FWSALLHCDAACCEIASTRLADLFQTLFRCARVSASLHVSSPFSNVRPFSQSIFSQSFEPFVPNTIWSLIIESCSSTKLHWAATFLRSLIIFSIGSPSACTLERNT
ncbi:unnamed protein product, partial [Ixodes pacificus]